MARFNTIVLCLAGLTLIGILTAFAGLRPVDDATDAKPPVSSAISQPAEDLLAEDQTVNMPTQWFNSPTPESLQGVALVIHGLNLRPKKMSTIIDNLTRAGIDVLSLSLRGHGENYAPREGLDADAARMETFKNVSYPLWSNEAYLAYKQAQKRAQQRQVPVFLAALSIGGLIGLDLFASHSEVQFDRIVLFAPAISLRATIYLERILSPFPGLVIPSLADDAYLSNKQGTPVAAYNALFDALYHFEENAGPKLDVPTLIFIDEQDEFIPLGGLKKLVEKHKLDQWKLYIVQKEEALGIGTFHHHIFDASATGEGVWQDMMSETVKGLLGNKQ
ncbi:MAG: alpha/beta fold hydrolase [Desulfobacterales bacterium]